MSVGAVLDSLKSVNKSTDRTQETGMSRLGQAWLALSLSAVAVLPARAQVTVDMSKITCEQYILFTMGDPKDIAMWLSGYYNAKRNNTVIDVQEFREAGKKVTDYCQVNLKTTVMDAAEKALGVKR
jgi:acid stress chaperone HdeB